MNLCKLNDKVFIYFPPFYESFMNCLCTPPVCLNTTELLSLNLFQDGPCPSIPQALEITSNISQHILNQCLKFVGDSKKRADLFFSGNPISPDWTSSCKEIYKAQGLIIRGTTLENEVDEKGQTHLHKAVINNNEAALSILLNSWENLDPKDNLGNTPLHLAVEQGKAKMVDALTSKEIKINSLNKAGDAPIHLAVKNGDAASLKYLICAGADVNIPQQQIIKGRISFNRKSPLYIAVELGRTEIARALLEAGAKPSHFINYSQDENPMYRTPISEAARLGNAEMVKLLLDFGATLNHIDPDGNMPLFYAIESGDFDTFMTVSQTKHNLLIFKDKNGKTPLYLAAELGFSDIVREMIKQRDVNFVQDIFTRDSEGRAVLDLVSKKGLAETTKVLKEGLKKYAFRTQSYLKNQSNQSDTEIARFFKDVLDFNQTQIAEVLKEGLNKNETETAEILNEIMPNTSTNLSLIVVLALAIASAAFLIKAKKEKNSLSTNSKGNSSPDEKIVETLGTAETSIRLIDLITKNQLEQLY